MGEHYVSEGLLARAKAGDAGSFEVMLTPLLRPSFRLAMTMLGSHEAAEDAVQEAALKAWRKIASFREGSEMRPWFLAIVANECRTVRRARWWRVIVSSDFLATTASAGSSAALADERVDLAAALDRLPHRHLLPLSLYYHLDLPIDEVARVLGCSPGAARVRVHRALRELRPAVAFDEVQA